MKNKISKSHSYFPTLIALLSVAFFFVIILGHALDEIAAWKIYDKFKNDENVPQGLNLFSQSVKGNFNDDPSEHNYFIGVSIGAVIFVPFFLLARSFRDRIKALREKITKTDYSPNSNDSLEKLNFTIGFRTAMLFLSFCIIIIAVFAINDLHGVFQWPVHLYSIILGFLLCEIFYLHFYFDSRLLFVKRIVQNMEEKEKVKPNNNHWSSDKLKMVIDSEVKTWTQMLQLHIFLFAGGITGVFLTAYSGEFFIKNISPEIRTDPLFEGILRPLVIIATVMAGAMFLVLITIQDYLGKLTQSLLEE